MGRNNRKRMKLRSDVIKEKEQSQLAIAELDMSQQEMPRTETLSQEREEQHRSLVGIVQQLDVLQQKMLPHLTELTSLFSGLKVLTKQVGEIAKETTCSICLSQSKSEREHCLVSLRCGHIFGECCIYKHLANKQFCPDCNQVAYPWDVLKLLGN